MSGVGDGTAKEVFSETIVFEQQIGIFQYFPVGGFAEPFELSRTLVAPVHQTLVMRGIIIQRSELIFLSRYKQRKSTCFKTHLLFG